MTKEEAVKEVAHLISSVHIDPVTNSLIPLLTPDEKQALNVATIFISFIKQGWPTTVAESERLKTI